MTSQKSTKTTPRPKIIPHNQRNSQNSHPNIRTPNVDQSQSKGYISSISQLRTSNPKKKLIIRNNQISQIEFFIPRLMKLMRSWYSKLQKTWKLLLSNLSLLNSKLTKFSNFYSNFGTNFKNSIKKQLGVKIERGKPYFYENTRNDQLDQYKLIASTNYFFVFLLLSI